MRPAPDASSPTTLRWLQLHVLPDALHVPASVAMGVVGALLVLQSTAGRRRRRSAR